MNQATNPNSYHRPVRLIALAVAIAVSVVGVVAALVYATDIFLILFLALLFGTFLTRTSRWLEAHIKLPYLADLGIVTGAIVLVFLLGITLFGVQIESQVDQAKEHLDTVQKQIQEISERSPFVESILSSTPFLRQLVDDKASDSGKTNESEQTKQTETDGDNTSNESTKQESISETEQSAIRSTTRRGFSAIAGVFSTTFGLLINSLLIFFVGLYLASSPQSYRDGIVVLFTKPRRESVRELLDQMGLTLWHWLIGQFGAMLVTGVSAGILLSILGVPMAISLGVVTGLLTFIPNIGALISLILAVLFSLPLGMSTAGAVAAGFILLQLIESYIVTPFIQEKQVSLPPALLISSQAIMGVLFGFLGTAVAAPLLAITKVGMERVYLEGILESDLDSNGSEHQTKSSE